MDSAILMTAMRAFIDTFVAGYGRIVEPMLTLLRHLAVMDLTLAGIGWMFGKGEVLAGFLQRVMLYCFFIYLVVSWPSLMQALLDGFMWLGVRAGGSTMTVAEMSNPSKIVELGLIATEPVFAHIRSYGFVAGMQNFGGILLSGLAGLAIFAGFVVIAIQIFVLFIEFYLVAVCSLALVPFGVNAYTAWISEQTFGTILGHGIKLMVLAFITSVAFPVLWLLKLPPDPGFGPVLSLLAGVWAITMLCWHAPTLAAGMLAGSPALTAGLYASTAAGGAILAGMLGGGGHSAGKSLVHGAQAAVRLARRHPGSWTPARQGPVGGGSGLMP